MMPKKPRKRVTIKQVAQEAEVSTQTVSRVINDRPDVASETRERVLGVIERLAYQPSAVARSLIQQRSYTLGVVTAGLKYFGPSNTLTGITQQAEGMGYSLLLTELPKFDTGDVHPILNSLLARQVDGIIWAVPEVGSNRDWLQDWVPELSVPIIFYTMEPRANLFIVAIDNRMGGRMATEHLLDLGYRHIGHIAGPLDWWEARERKAGWQEALLDAGMGIDDRQWVEGDWSAASGERAIYQMLEQFPEMDAVFVANDQMSLAVLHVACRKGLWVPHDLAVVGFDAMPEGAYFWPPLTSVWQDVHELGYTAVRELVGMIGASRQPKHDCAPKLVFLQPQLVVRESSVAR
jgi:DNA-binding LacI/PurR family transcriptional regulator